MGIGGCVGESADLGSLEKRRLSCPCTESKNGSTVTRKFITVPTETSLEVKNGIRNCKEINRKNNRFERFKSRCGRVATPGKAPHCIFCKIWGKMWRSSKASTVGCFILRKANAYIWHLWLGIIVSDKVNEMWEFFRQHDNHTSRVTAFVEGVCDVSETGLWVKRA